MHIEGNELQVSAVRLPISVPRPVARRQASRPGSRSSGPLAPGPSVGPWIPKAATPIDSLVPGIASSPCGHTNSDMLGCGVPEIAHPPGPAGNAIFLRIGVVDHLSLRVPRKLFPK